MKVITSGYWSTNFVDEGIRLISSSFPSQIPSILPNVAGIIPRMSRFPDRNARLFDSD